MAEEQKTAPAEEPLTEAQKKMYQAGLTALYTKWFNKLSAEAKAPVAPTKKRKSKKAGA